MIFLSKPFVPVAGNDIVEGIPDEFWDDHQTVQQFPSAIQVFADPDSG